MKGGDDLTNRVWAASEQRSIDHEVRAMHLARIRGELERPIHVAPTVMTTAPTPIARRWRLAATAAAFAILPVTAMTAANSALPGDRLYPTKRAVERAMIVVDDDVVASNRIEELEALIRRHDRPEVIAAAQRDADQEIRWLAADNRLATRLSELFIGWGSGQYRLDRAIDWSDGDLFISSLPDGDLLWITRQVGTNTPEQYELSVSGSWTVMRSEQGWRISNPVKDPATGKTTAFDIEVGPNGILITSVEDLSEPDQPSTRIAMSEDDTAPPASSSVPNSAAAGAPTTPDSTPSPEPTSTTTPAQPGPPTTSPQGSDLTQPTRPTTTTP